MIELGCKGLPQRNALSYLPAPSFIKKFTSTPPYLPAAQRDHSIHIEIACGLYYKHVMIINDASSGVNKLKASLNDAARGVIYEHHMFIVQAPGEIKYCHSFTT
jgi:hypothetical protein